jgi:hypothetical protein
MKTILKFIKQYSWSFFLGAGTQMISGYGLYNWQWWAFVVPLILLVGIKDYGKDNSSNI